MEQPDFGGIATREAAAILDGSGISMDALARDTLVSLLKIAWYNGAIYGEHRALGHMEDARRKAAAEL